MKYFIIVMFALGLLSCKKTEKLKPEVLPDTYVNPTYIGELDSYLKIGVGSNGPIDSIFTFYGSLTENSANAPYITFNKITYNGNTTGSVDQGVNFLNFANQSNWDLRSDYIGNFTHTDNTPVALITNPVGSVPSSFSGNAFIVNLHNLSGADEVVVSSYDGINLQSSSQKIDVFGPNFAFNFTAGVADLPINTDIRITIRLRKHTTVTKNGATIEVNKFTEYVFKTRKTS